MQIGYGKQGVRIGEYKTSPNTEEDGNAILGWIEPACKDPQWILWFTVKGDAIFHQKRESSGAVLDKPIRVKGHERTLVERIEKPDPEEDGLLMMAMGKFS